MAIFVIVTIAAAIAVYTDASKQRRCALGMWPIWWAVLTLLTNIVGFAAYWAMHHSTLRREEDEGGNHGQ
ncbi:MAG: hypothetical protein QNJ00_07890 [Woeseiaceae bacterium]|nr:hypothetical protein [Woeseiaceae bacterium]